MIITRGFGTNNKIITRGYGGEIVTCDYREIIPFNLYIDTERIIEVDL